MTVTDLQQKFPELLNDFLTETFEKVNGIYLDRSTSLFETLDTITAEEASQPVSPTCATLAAQTAHVRFYVDVLIQYLSDNPPEKVDWGEIWRTVGAVTPDEWQASQTALRESYQRARTLMDGIEEWDYDHAGNAMAIIVHTAYHLGEIRQALCTLKQR